jgi:parallel beta-helix repeat protein
MATWTHKVNGDIIDADHINKLQDDKLDRNLVPCVFPEDYGAIGNGVHNDTAAIQAAINDGFLVLFSDNKTYLIDDEILIPDNVTLLGMGANAIIKCGITHTYSTAWDYWSMFKSADYATNLIGNENIRIRGITFDANGANQTPAYREFNYIINFIGVRNSEILDNRFINICGDGIFLSSTDGIVPSANHCETIRISGNYFNGNSLNRNGISIIDASGVIIDYNRFEDVGGGIDFEPDAVGMEIQHCVVNGNRLTNVVIGITAYTAISGAGLLCDNLIISNNVIDTITGATHYGINVINFDFVSIIGNSIANSAHVGINVQEADHLTVSGNIVRATAEESIVVYDCHDVTIANNTLSDWDTSLSGWRPCVNGFYSTGVVFSGNSIDGTGSVFYAIQTQYSCDNWTIIGNSITNTTLKYYLVGNNTVIDDTIGMNLVDAHVQLAALHTDGGPTFDHVHVLGTTEYITDGGLENWASPTNLTSWSETLAGTSTVNQEGADFHGGSNACRLDVDAGNNNVNISQTVTLVAGMVYKLSLWYKTAAGKNAMLQVHDGGTNVFLNSAGVFTAINTSVTLPTATVWTKFELTFTTHGAYTNYELILARNSSASSSIYFDDISIIGVSYIGSPSRIETDLTVTGELTADHLHISNDVLINAATPGTNGVDLIGIKNGTAPTAHVDDEIQMFSVDSSDAAATLGLFLEQAVEAVDSYDDATHKVKVKINGVEYWILLEAV